jgi:uncharacterized protein (DUF169 family)
MEESVKIKIDYAECSATLKKYLGLAGSPVALMLATKKEMIPEGMKQIEGKYRHCGMVSMARKDGKIFYATVDNHECMGGAWALGLREITDTLKSGQFYFKLGKFESWAACKRTIDKIHHLDTKETYATLYAPLEKTPFAPHVILIIANPRGMLKLAQSVLFRLGGRIYPEFSGIQSVCSDAAAQTYLTGKPNFSLGCDGSRKFSGIADDEMVMGIPGELLPEVSEAIKIVTGAPGSV